MLKEFVEKLTQGLIFALNAKVGPEIRKYLVESDILFDRLLNVAKHALDLSGGSQPQVNGVPREVINEGQIHEVFQDADHFEVRNKLPLPLGVVENLARSDVQLSEERHAEPKYALTQEAARLFEAEEPGKQRNPLVELGVLPDTAEELFDVAQIYLLALLESFVRADPRVQE